MNYLKNLKEQFTFDQLLLIFTCFSFTFPFYILGPILLIEFIYLLVSKKAIIALKQTPQIKFLYLFVLISLSISIIHKNILGALATLGIFIGDKDYRDNGYGAEAIRLILEYGFRYLNLHNIKLDLMELTRKKKEKSLEEIVNEKKDDN